jgi:hypothetical protein
MYEPASDRSIEVAALRGGVDQAVVCVSRNVEVVIDGSVAKLKLKELAVDVVRNRDQRG